MFRSASNLYEHLNAKNYLVSKSFAKFHHLLLQRKGSFAGFYGHILRFMFSMFFFEI